MNSCFPIFVAIILLCMTAMCIDSFLKNQKFLQDLSKSVVNNNDKYVKHQQFDTEERLEEKEENEEIQNKKDQEEIGGDENRADTLKTGEESMNSISDEDVKLVVIHVGPHKTGTTTLQRFILNNEVVKIALQGDNYKVPIFHYGQFGAVENDPKNHAVMANCFLQGKENTFCPPDIRDKVLDEFKTFIGDAAKTDSNILISSEAFDFESLDITELMSYFLPHQYKLHVVVSYRRFYEWVHSTYAQRSKKPALSGKEFLTFPRWMGDGLRKNMNVKYSRSVYDRFKNNPSVSNVTIVNLHQSSTSCQNIAEVFFCDHLDGAPLTCEAAKMQQKLRDNFSEPLDKEWLRSQIRKNHPISLAPDDKRWKEIEDKFQSADNLPRICLDDEQQEKILDISVQAEKAMTPESWYNSQRGLEALKADFESKVNLELCSIDFPAMVASDDWQNFLTELQK